MDGLFAILAEKNMDQKRGKNRNKRGSRAEEQKEEEKKEGECQRQKKEKIKGKRTRRKIFIRCAVLLNPCAFLLTGTSKGGNELHEFFQMLARRHGVQDVLPVQDSKKRYPQEDEKRRAEKRIKAEE
ncbi:hypothetical protein M514_11219 [Trichuris suis]|uniref:Uncharacterized protein n=1 Tax=Trichuris suis TaxID=68888 RepID=A0A085LSI2_9BILA|nr:hypothetical protein M513_11219 [Trichuris suis]KFD67999.1 hypothetical protein M514_11219 [Trichuris suis]